MEVKENGLKEEETMGKKGRGKEKEKHKGKAK
jgi:hypothetical protein